MKCIVYIAAFTRKGIELAKSLERNLAKDSIAVWVFAPKRFAIDGVLPISTLDAWTKRAFEAASALIFVSATGIAVRAIAPYLKDKMKDPAVVSIDEAGQYVIPLASGHIGGANDLARKVATISGGVAAISTATDVNKIFAVDEWGARNGLSIIERDLAKKVSAALLEEKTIGFTSDFPISGLLPKGLTFDKTNCELGISVSAQVDKNPFPETLHLVPKIIIAGVGCKKNAAPQILRETIESSLKALGLPSSSICALASIDIKRDELAILSLSQLYGWNPVFYSADQLNEVKGSFADSEFVKQTIGVGNVCERASIKAVAQAIEEVGIDAKPQIILGKQSNNGTTFAIACAAPALAFPPTRISS